MAVFPLAVFPRQCSPWRGLCRLAEACAHPGGGYDSLHEGVSPPQCSPPQCFPRGRVPRGRVPRGRVPRRSVHRGGGCASSRRRGRTAAGVMTPSTRAYQRRRVPHGSLSPPQSSPRQSFPTAEFPTAVFPRRSVPHRHVPRGSVPHRSAPFGGSCADSRRPARTPAGVTTPSTRAYQRRSAPRRDIRDIRYRLTKAANSATASRARKSTRGCPPGTAVR